MKRTIRNLIALLAFVIISLTISVNAQSNNNSGKDFYFTFLPAYVEDTLKTNKLRVYVTSTVRTLVTVEIPGKNYIQTQYTIPNDMIQFILEPEIGQCYKKYAYSYPLPDSVFKNCAVHVYADDSIVVYGMTKYYYTTDGFMAIPTSKFGTEYIVSSYGAINAGTFNSETAIVASVDNTTVSFTLGGNNLTETMGGLKLGETKQIVMNKGDVWLISSKNQNADLSGSKVISDNPVGVLSGHFCAYVPVNVSACDCLNEMEIPTEFWGKEILVPNIAQRLKNSIIKIFSKEPNTKIYRNGDYIGTLTTSGGIEDIGFFHVRADTGSPKPIVISGDNQIGVTLFNPGQLDDRVISDPFQMLLSPIEQFQNEIIFGTPGIKGGAGFDVNFLSIIFQGNVDGTVPDDMEYGKSINSNIDWKKLNVEFGKNTNGVFNSQSLQNKYYLKTIQLPEDGVYSIRASRPFGAYCYGFSPYESYGFPASMLLLPVKYATFEIGCDSAYPGQFIKIPITLISQKNIYGTNTKTFKITIDFDASMLDAVDYPNLPVNNGRKEITFEVQLNSGNNNILIKEINFKALNSSISYSDIRFISVTPNSGHVFIDTINGCFKLKNFGDIPYCLLQAGDGSGIPGDIIAIPLYLKNSKYIINTGVKYIDADLSFNATLLYPIDYPDSKIKDGLRTISLKNLSVSIDTNEIIKMLKFQAALGNSRETPLTILNQKTVGDSIYIGKLDGKFTLLGVCPEGGDRLLNTESGNIQLFQVIPNPVNETADIEFELIEDGTSKIFIINSLGEKVKTVLDGKHNLGRQKIKINTKELPSGTYFIILQTPTEIRTQQLMIMR